ncbi:MAG: CBS domain-containing protein [Planctomycetes bacterium]|nr:CBS domain-containing protein [Planctomycetota bacterium]
MGLRENILTDPVSELELRDLVPVDRKATVREAAALMRDHRLGCVVIVDAAGKPVGKFTERLLMSGLLKDPACLDKPVEKFMYADANPIRQDAPIADMIRMLKDRELRFLCVTDGGGKAAALTGPRGLMEYVADHFPRQVKVQKMDSKVYMEKREGA